MFQGLRTRGLSLGGAVALALATLGSAPAQATRPTQAARPNLVELAQSAPQLSLLVEAVVKTGLVDELSGPGPVTVFAPTNAAFEAALGELGFASLHDVPVDALRDILLDHVVEGNQRLKRLAFLDRVGRDLVAVGGLILEFDRNPVEVNDIRVVAGNLHASNGVAHIIEAVLLDPDPRPSLAELAASVPSLSVLVEAAQRTGLDVVLDAGAPFTVFAPTNEAFEALLSALGLTSLDEVDDRTLVNTLLDHIVATEIDDDELRAFSRTRAMGGLPLWIDGRRRVVNGVQILGPAVEAGNGTAFVIDGVLGARTRH